MYISVLRQRGGIKTKQMYFINLGIKEKIVKMEGVREGNDGRKGEGERRRKKGEDGWGKEGRVIIFVA